MNKYRYLLALLAMLCFALPLIADTAENQLKQHHSPYLALHGNDPIQWQEWQESALKQAQQQDKLIFVSIGYFACHWCHVMQRESFKHPVIANLLNQNFISVKVDRELNPVLDKQLIEFVQATTGIAGWPLNVFLTPEGYPLIGATYLPRETFQQVLIEINDKWQKNKKAYRERARLSQQELTNLLARLENKRSDKTYKGLQKHFIEVTMQHADTLQGGFGEQQKFPQIPQLWALLKLYKVYPNNDVKQFLELTLKQMAEQGLHDALNGGFYRYTVDPDWATPHFEKMLYTNALMPLLYFEAADILKNPDHKKVAFNTINFVLKHMQGTQGAFISSLSALDSNDVEGGYYLWTNDELKTILNKDEQKLVRLYWGMGQGSSDLEQGYLPRQQISIEALTRHLTTDIKQVEQRLQRISNKLVTYQNEHRQLPRDTKLLTASNSLMLAALSKVMTFDKRYKKSADALATFLTSLWDGSVLKRSSVTQLDGTLQDYAAASWALSHYANASKKNDVKKKAAEIMRTAWQKFYKDAIWQESENSLLPHIPYRRHIEDSATLSAETLLIEATLMLDDKKYAAFAWKLLKQITIAQENTVMDFASFLSVDRSISK